MSHYSIRFSVVHTLDVEADTIEGAKAIADAGMSQWNETCLLSIIKEGVLIETSGGPDPKAPTPFNRPPAGTPGGGDSTKIVELVDQIAVAA